MLWLLHRARQSTFRSAQAAACMPESSLLAEVLCTADGCWGGRVGNVLGVGVPGRLRMLQRWPHTHAHIGSTNWTQKEISFLKNIKLERECMCGIYEESEGEEDVNMIKIYCTLYAHSTQR